MVDRIQLLVQAKLMSQDEAEQANSASWPRTRLAFVSTIMNG